MISELDALKWRNVELSNEVVRLRAELDWIYSKRPSIKNNFITREMDAEIRKRAGKDHPVTIARAIGKTINVVRNYAVQEQISLALRNGSRVPWSQEEYHDAMRMRHTEKMTLEAIGAVLGRSRKSVEAKLNNQYVKRLEKEIKRQSPNSPQK